MRQVIIPGALILGLAACGETETAPAAQADAFVWPDSAAAFGDGFPNAGDPCRQLGESPATSNYLDHTAQLVGCPTAVQARALGGEIVGEIEGVTVVSVPAGDTGTGMGENGPAVGSGGKDALVPGTDFNATAQISCGFGGAAPTTNCAAGVKRNWGEDGTTLVEVTKPDGTKRALFFAGTEPAGADSAQADGSAGWDFKWDRKSDQVTISFGPETYVIVDAFVEGG